MGKKYIRYSYNHRGFQVFIAIYLTICTLFSLLSLFITILNACKTNANIVSNGIFGLLEGNVFQIIGDNFQMAWSKIGKSFWNSILFSFLGALLDCLVGAILGYVFTFKEFPFKKFLFTLYISVMLLRLSEVDMKVVDLWQSALRTNNQISVDDFGTQWHYCLMTNWPKVAQMHNWKQDSYYMSNFGNPDYINN